VNALSHAAAAFSVGFVLGAAPGPVQVVLLTEASRGGIRRGLQAMVAANLTLAALGAILAVWLAGITISADLLRTVRVAGGLFLIYAGVDTWRNAHTKMPTGADGEADADAAGPRATASPAVRGMLAVLLNPGALLFLATTGSALLAAASADGGTGLALFTLAALVLGVAAVDFVAVMVGSQGRRLSDSRRALLFRVLGSVLVGIGVAFLVGAAVG
jgi:threonine/homoserine/homoserine lactone efflux protein